MGWERYNGGGYCLKCVMCGNWGDEDHLRSRKHRRKKEYNEHKENYTEEEVKDISYQGEVFVDQGVQEVLSRQEMELARSVMERGDAATTAATRAVTPLVSPPPSLPDMWRWERYNGGGYCLKCVMCGNWGDEDHLRSRKHRRKKEYNEHKENYTEEEVKDISYQGEVFVDQGVQEVLSRQEMELARSVMERGDAATTAATRAVTPLVSPPPSLPDMWRWERYTAGYGGYCLKCVMCGNWGSEQHLYSRNHKKWKGWN